MTWKEQIENKILTTKNHPIKEISLSKDFIEYEGIVLHKKVSKLKSEEVVRANLIHKGNL